MAHPMLLLLLAFALALFAYSLVASAEIVEHSLHVQNLTISPLCKQQVITAANGSLPGPTIQVHEGDTLIVHVFNKSPYNLTIHWHGVFQLQSGWADGPEFVTQCPIVPGNNYTYRFTITGQEGTLWWHAHSNWLRATVHGALIIQPRKGHLYPFPKPVEEFPILLGEWWNANIMDIENQALGDGHGPNVSDAFTINGQPGDLYNCTSFGTYKLKVVRGKTYLLRIINVALYSELFFKIANHTMTVVAVDACYTNPMVTDVMVISPGQTIDVLLTADQPPASYYMAAHCYDSLGDAYDETTTTGIVTYENATPSSPLMPNLPAADDTSAAFKFYSSVTSLVNGPHWAPVPLKIDEKMFLTEGLGLVPCGANNTCGAPLGLQFAASMNNESFELPTKLSMLEASYYNLTSGIYTTDFPKYPPVVFDYTNTSNALNTALVMTSRSTKVTKLRYNSTVEIVFQNTALVGEQSHPMHLHGYNFYVLAQGFGNYDPATGPKMFNLVNPQIRNTVGVPVGGWTVIRFTANNPV
ncbi:laccase-7-like isoform X2 [Rhododendron vialii]|uniref:laccase-7-like isoform X2 n=1 Tax=Rhododendron vialii TaxID=182163 RepID=UPI00265ED353|nr:laccase-7-like isoform X2 [Rhododendron vialii]